MIVFDNYPESIKDMNYYKDIMNLLNSKNHCYSSKDMSKHNALISLIKTLNDSGIPASIV